MSKQKKSIDTNHFVDVEFMTADEKRKVLRAWIRFIKNNFGPKQFSKALYNHLIMHCSFIAHYSRGGFWEAYFKAPEDTQRFLNQFDHTKGCVSVEYGGTAWLRGDYNDINNAMVAVLEPYLPELRRNLHAGEFNAQAALAAQAKVNSLREETKR